MTDLLMFTKVEEKEERKCNPDFSCSYCGNCQWQTMEPTKQTKRIKRRHTVSLLLTVLLAIYLFDNHHILDYLKTYWWR